MATRRTKIREYGTPRHILSFAVTLVMKIYGKVSIVYSLLHNRNQFISLIYLMEGKTCSKIDITNLNLNENKLSFLDNVTCTYSVIYTPYISQLFAFHGC